MYPCGTDALFCPRFHVRGNYPSFPQQRGPTEAARWTVPPQPQLLVVEWSPALPGWSCAMESMLRGFPLLGSGACCPPCLLPKIQSVSSKSSRLHGVAWAAKPRGPDRLSGPFQAGEGPRPPVVASVPAESSLYWLPAARGRCGCRASWRLEADSARQCRLPEHRGSQGAPAQGYLLPLVHRPGLTQPQR